MNLAEFCEHSVLDFDQKMKALTLDEIMQVEEELKEKKEFDKVKELYANWLSVKALAASELDESGRKEVALAFNNRGHIKYLQVDFDGAMEDYDKSLEYDDRLPYAYYNRGTVSYRMGYFEKAFQDLKKATELLPENEEFRVGLQRCVTDLN